MFINRLRLNFVFQQIFSFRLTRGQKPGARRLIFDESIYKCQCYGKNGTQDLVIFAGFKKSGFVILRKTHLEIANKQSDNHDDKQASQISSVETN